MICMALPWNNTQRPGASMPPGGRGGGTPGAAGFGGIDRDHLFCPTAILKGNRNEHLKIVPNQIHG